MTTLYEYIVEKQMQGNNRGFWGRYEELNNAWFPAPTAQAIHNYQLEKIKQAQKLVEDSAAANSSKFQQLSDMILSTDNRTIQEYSLEQDKEIQEAIQRIFENISEMRSIKNRESKKKNIFLNAAGRHEQYSDMMNSMQKLYNQLVDLKNTLQINNSVYDNQLITIQNTLNELSNKVTIRNNAFNLFWKDISTFQGDLLENLGAAWFNQKIPQNIGVKMVATGNVVLRTNEKNERHGGQLISDLLALSINGDNLDKITLEYDLGDKKNQTATLREFISLLESHTGNEKIIINDNTYDTLLSLSVLNVQAKSGKKQLPWNINKSTQIKINDFSDEAASGYISAWRTFNLLYSLDTKPPYDKWVKNEDPDNYYQALANYGLATALWKVVHLDHKDGNQYLLTPKGFMTFTQRFYEIFGKTPSTYARLNGSVFKNGRLVSLNTPFNVSVPWQSIQ